MCQRPEWPGPGHPSLPRTPGVGRLSYRDFFRHTQAVTVLEPELVSSKTHCFSEVRVPSPGLPVTWVTVSESLPA